MERVTETREFNVPVEEGHLIGDILRKYATRITGGWQVIGYKIDSTSPNFGFSNGAFVSYLELLHGYIICKDNVAINELNSPELRTFTWNGSFFDSDGFELHGLTAAVGQSIVACLHYAHGHRTAEQNREILKKKLPDSVESYLAVPSSHTRVSTFRYKISPVDEHEEKLAIEADTGVLNMAVNAAIRSLTGLGI